MMVSLRLSRLLRSAVAMAAFALALPLHAAGIQQAFLVQNSGWMEPFYTDPQSQLKALVGAVAQAASTPDDPLFLLAFSQSNGGNVSPLLLGQGRGASAIAGQLAPLGLAHKGSGNTLADTDFQEAVTKTITGPFRSASGIVWIFTNNKNSPNNDSQTAERNRDFYRLLHLEPSITKTLVYALRMPVQGKLYSAKGLMVYALAYGQPAAEALNRIQAEGRLSQVLTRAPARLKPVDQDAVRIVPQSVQNSANVHASLGRDGRTIVLDVDAEKLVPKVVLQASLQNMFFPYVIEHATVQATLAGQAAPLQVSPGEISGLLPGASQQVEVRFDLPMAQIPSPWSTQALAAMGKQVLLPMTATVGLAGQKLALSPEFSQQLQDLFPGDPISEVFTPPDSVRASQATVPLLVRIQYPLLPVLLITGAILLLLLAFVLFGLLSTSSKRYRIVVNGLPRQVLLKPYKSLVIKDDGGREIGAIRRGLGKPVIVRVADGQTLALG
ncbi:hypothetical protein [Janthinobacterium sp.]|uniref:hypothetical protein n=1 Tax=Janthinobacterium sp. TaxID=1871054 RepID=UPI002622AAF5|nr:hypothetical protein [Janthinobacterium sp.]